jgi:hypothetical protein
MKPSNPILRERVALIVDLKLQAGAKRARLNYAEIAAACGVKKNTLARAVCIELRRRKSEINQFHGEQ